MDRIDVLELQERIVRQQLTEMNKEQCIAFAMWAYRQLVLIEELHRMVTEC